MLSIIFQSKAPILQTLIIQVFIHQMMLVNTDIFEIMRFPLKMAFPTTFLNVLNEKGGNNVISHLRHFKAELKPKIFNVFLNILKFVFILNGIQEIYYFFF